MQGKLFSFEGIDCCGKSTQIKKLEEYLKKKNIPVFVAKEPGTTAIGGLLRKVLKHPKETYEFLNQTYKLDPDFTELPVDQQRTAEAEMLLFLAARAEFIQHVIKPHLNDGFTVLCDRFIDSTRAYQGGGRYNSEIKKIDIINILNNFVTIGISPTKTFLFNISYEEMLKRKKEEKPDFMESQGNEFFKRVIHEYKILAKENADRFVLIDGTKSIDEIFNNEIVQVINKLYGF